MRARRIIALIFLIAGVAALIASVASMAGHPKVLTWLGALAGVLLIVVGLILFVTELMERWLIHGQRALVDGLQAG